VTPNFGTGTGNAGVPQTTGTLGSGSTSGAGSPATTGSIGTTPGTASPSAGGADPNSATGTPSIMAPERR
jgi:hypothetical protein